MGYAIETNALSKAYGSTKALDRLNLTIDQGEIFGYLGPNGAGKTTTIRILLDLIRPDSGSAQILNKDVREQSISIHEQIGFLPAELSLPKNRTGNQIVRHIAEVRGMDTVRQAHVLAERFTLDMSKKMRDYSTGNKRKLGLVISMMHNPDVYIMDEPTSGLDPLLQNEFNALLLELREQGKTFFLSSHLLSEVQAVCDRVGILRGGQLKAVETIDDLTRVDFRWVTVGFRENVPQSVLDAVGKIEGASNLKADLNELTLRLTGDFNPLLDAIHGNYVTELHLQEPTLEEIFLNFYSDNGGGR